jgi:hypothetical protein
MYVVDSHSPIDDGLDESPTRRLNVKKIKQNIASKNSVIVNYDSSSMITTPVIVNDSSSMVTTPVIVNDSSSMVTTPVIVYDSSSMVTTPLIVNDSSSMVTTHVIEIPVVTREVTEH